MYSLSASRFSLKEWWACALPCGCVCHHDCYTAGEGVEIAAQRFVNVGGHELGLFCVQFSSFGLAALRAVRCTKAVESGPHGTESVLGTGYLNKPGNGRDSSPVCLSYSNVLLVQRSNFLCELLGFGSSPGYFWESE